MQKKFKNLLLGGVGDGGMFIKDLCFFLFQMFQEIRLFQGLYLFRTLEYYVFILCCKLKNGRTMTIVIHQLSLNIMSLNQDCTVCDLTE